MMDWLPYIIWCVASALLCWIAALALRRWMPRRSVCARTAFATMIAIFPVFILVGWAILPSYGAVLLSMSPDEFLIPVSIQIVMILIVATPIAWLVSRRRGKDRTFTNVFD